MELKFLICLKCMLLLYTLHMSAVVRAFPVIEPVRYLALGDSYTIGTGVTDTERWPHQLRDSLKMRDYDFESLEIIARVGWRTDELIQTLETVQPGHNHTLVSLLIGVNNQFQGRPPAVYETEFSQLLDMAINYAGGDPNRVMVLSIPDYAYTPFGQWRFSDGISSAIDQFNEINLRVTASRDVWYVDVTDISRRGLDEPELVAADGLHPSGLQYGLWVSRILEDIESKDVTSDGRREINGQQPALQLFLMPGGRELRIALNYEIKRPLSASIFNIKGLLIRQFLIESNVDERLDISDLPTGFYIMHVSDGRQNYQAKFVLP